MKSIKSLFGATDMTSGVPWKQIGMFAIPMLIGNIAQQLYNTVDSIVVGRYVGDNALAAVGSAGPIFNLMLVLFMGISTGTGILVAQYYGAKSRENLSITIGNSIVASAICYVVVLIIGPLLSGPLLRLLNTPESIYEWCRSYLNILFIGMVGLIYYNILCGILRGLGDSFSALLYLLVATALNIVLDLLFVAVLGLGVPGVALATVIAQTVSAVLCMVKLCHMRDLFDLKKRHFKVSRHHMARIVGLGIPAGITQAIFSMAMIVVQSLTNSFGEMFIAANVIVMRVDGFAMMPNFSYGTAMTTYAGQNVGAKKYDRVVKGAKQGTWMAVLTSAVITGLILIFGKYLMGIFTTTKELVTLSMNLMRIIAVGYLASGVTQSLSGVMRGAGDTMTPMWISILSSVIIRVPLAYGLVYLTRSAAYPNGRSEMIFVSLLISWLLGGAMTLIMYLAGRWKKKAGMTDAESAD